MLKHASSVGREELVCAGTKFGKFTKSRKFRMHVTALDYLAQFAKVRPLVASHCRR
ncbi:MAG: NIP7 N-terminal domain-related protein [Hydrogenophaga sp.]